MGNPESVFLWWQDLSAVEGQVKQLRELLTAESDSAAGLVKKQTEEAATALHAMAIGQKRHGDKINQVSDWDGMVGMGGDRLVVLRVGLT